jgi:hypothetical protein
MFIAYISLCILAMFGSFYVMATNAPPWFTAILAFILFTIRLAPLVGLLAAIVWCVKDLLNKDNSTIRKAGLHFAKFYQADRVFAIVTALVLLPLVIVVIAIAYPIFTNVSFIPSTQFRDITYVRAIWVAVISFILRHSPKQATKLHAIASG